MILRIFYCPFCELGDIAWRSLPAGLPAVRLRQSRLRRRRKEGRQVCVNRIMTRILKNSSRRARREWAELA
jgi:hypothetical protein